MPKLAEQYDRRQFYAEVYKTYPRISEVRPLRTYGKPEHAQKSNVRPLQVNKKKVKRNNILHKIISTAFFTMIACCVLPLGFNRVTMSFLHGSQYPEIKTDYHQLRFPTTDYLSNDLIFNQRYLTGAEVKHPQMQKISETYRMGDLENSLKNLMAQYPSLHPSVYVWQYDTEKFADINASETFSAKKSGFSAARASLFALSAQAAAITATPALREARISLTASPMYTAQALSTFSLFKTLSIKNSLPVADSSPCSLMQKYLSIPITSREISSDFSPLPLTIAQ